MIELRIGGRAVDISPDTQITLEFKSNLFGDISEITASNSMTISLPKTPTNNQVFGLPSVIGGMSSAPYRKFDAEMYVNGVQVVSAAYAVLLSVGESYEISLYWGVAKALSKLKDNDKSINELNEVLSIKYGGNDWWNGWEGKIGNDGNGNVSDDIINATYDSGIANLASDATARSQYALLPSVRAKWVWDTILKEAGLVYTTPQIFQLWMERVALPFTTHKTTNAEPFTLQFKKSNKKYNRFQKEGVITFHTADGIPTSAFFEIRTLEVPLYIGTDKKDFDATVYTSKAEGRVRLTCSVQGSRDSMSPAIMYIEHRNSEHLYAERVSEQLPEDFTKTLSIEVEMKEGDYLLPYVEWRFKEDGVRVSSASVHFEVSYDDDVDQVMGGIINTRDNLPDISQVDFVKCLSAMGGLWATLVDSKVHFVDYADFYNGAQPTLDWSHKLIGTSDGDAMSTTYSLDNFAQRNLLTYAEDDKDKVEANGTLFVDNENLEEETAMVELPFAASKGNTIPHLAYKEETNAGGTREIEEIDIEPRIMILNESISIDGRKASLTFDGLSWSNLIAKNYKYWQKIMRNPIVIEEQMRLTEVDIKELDYRKPIYLQKYGARFAVQQVQWSEGEPSQVTLVYLPPKEDISVAMPYTVTTGVAISEPGNQYEVVVRPELASLARGGGKYFAENAILSFNDTTGAMYDLKFVRWASPSGRTISTENPYIYDGRNGDLEIIALTEESLVIG